MLSSYLLTLGDMAIAVIGIALVSFAIYKLLPRLGMSREAATGFALIMPWLLGFLIWTAIPYCASLYYSFTDYNVFQAPNCVGLDNYVRILTNDTSFWPSLSMTLLYGAISLPLGLAGALGVAMLLARKVRGIGVWRTLYYLPAVIPGVAVILLWRWLLGTDGLFNLALSPIYNALGMARPSWFTDENYALARPDHHEPVGRVWLQRRDLAGGHQEHPGSTLRSAELDGAGTGPSSGMSPSRCSAPRCFTR